MTDLPQEWLVLDVASVAEILADTPVRWWISGGAALDHWLGEQIRPRPHTDISVVHTQLTELVDSLPEGYDAWMSSGGVIADTNDPEELLEADLVPYTDEGQDGEIHPVLIRDVAENVWVIKVNVEDGAPRAWVYKRDPRLSVPWDEAVLDIDGIPTGAPEIQLLWKTLRPRPGDEQDKDAVLPKLSEAAHTRYERGVLAIHPHSTWAIHVRTPLTPAKASWNTSRANQR